VSASTEIPTESVSFSYDSIKLEYSVQDAKGVVTTTGSSTYSVSKNTVT